MYKISKVPEGLREGGEKRREERNREKMRKRETKWPERLYTISPGLEYLHLFSFSGSSLGQGIAATLARPVWSQLLTTVSSFGDLNIHLWLWLQVPTGPSASWGQATFFGLPFLFLVPAASWVFYWMRSSALPWRTAGERVDLRTLSKKEEVGTGNKVLTWDSTLRNLSGAR